MFSGSDLIKTANDPRAVSKSWFCFAEIAVSNNDKEASRFARCDAARKLAELVVEDIDDRVGCMVSQPTLTTNVVKQSEV